MNCLWAPMSCLNACCNKITISTAPKPQEEHPTNCRSGRPQCKIFRNLPLHATNTAKQVSQLFAAYHGVKWKWTRCNIHLAPTFLSIWWHGNLKAKNGLVQLGRSCVVHHFHSFFLEEGLVICVFPFPTSPSFIFHRRIDQSYLIPWMKNCYICKGFVCTLIEILEPVTLLFFLENGIALRWHTT
jgi:hypothetical protein